MELPPESTKVETWPYGERKSTWREQTVPDKCLLETGS